MQSLQLVNGNEANLSNCLYAESFALSPLYHVLQVGAKLIEDDVEVTAVTLTVSYKLVKAEVFRLFKNLNLLHEARLVSLWQLQEIDVDDILLFL
jgi:hypothetical protein